MFYNLAMKRKIITTEDGSVTIHLEEWNESYHSKHGAIQEAYHVFIKNGLDLFTNEVSILEIGFGTGLNAFITYLEMQKRNLKVNYVGVEAYPISPEEILQMNFVTELNATSESEVFKLYAEIIEITEKPDIPSGELGENVAGNTFESNKNHDLGSSSLRAILDIGLLDMQPQYLEVEDEKITIVDASSDMLVVDITNSENKYHVGDLISFTLKYMGALHLLNSDYIEKRVE